LSRSRSSCPDATPGPRARLVCPVCIPHFLTSQPQACPGFYNGMEFTGRIGNNRKEGSSQGLWETEVPQRGRVGSRDKAPIQGLGDVVSQKLRQKCEISIQFSTFFPVKNLGFNDYRSRARTVLSCKHAFQKLPKIPSMTEV